MLRRLFYTSLSVFFISSYLHTVSSAPIFPLWPYVVHIGVYEPATLAAYNVLQNSSDVSDSTVSLNAITAGITQCEMDQCWNAIGYGNNADENNEVTLDALIIDGVTLDVGAVADLRK
jgi:N4-(beta-N-acetylglucosaminyl)-L-asparaginase